MVKAGISENIVLTYSLTTLTKTLNNTQRVANSSIQPATLLKKGAIDSPKKLECYAVRSGILNWVKHDFHENKAMLSLGMLKQLSCQYSPT